MTRTIINMLKADDLLKDLLQATTKDSKIYPFGTSSVQNCILYKNVPVLDDGIKAQYRLEVTVIALDMGIGEQLLAQVKKILLTLGDTKKHSKILACGLSGGGVLENLETNTIHYKAYFNYTVRS